MTKYVMTIGVFDGVHMGHQQLLNTVKQNSVKYGYKSKAYVISYPFEYFSDDFDGLIMPLTARVLQISKFVDEVEVLDLLEIKDMTAEEFFDRYIVQDCSFLIVGEDFRFGKGASADVARLKQMCDINAINFEVFPQVLDSKNRRISSSLIRKLIKNGDLLEASKLLGRDFSIYGFTQETAERVVFVNIDDRIVRPAKGVFQAFEKNFKMNGIVRFNDRIAFVCENFRAASHTALEIVLSERQEGDER